MMKTNYHTHTYRCMHALNVEDEMYVLSAIEAGFSKIAFTDHVFYPSIKYPEQHQDRMHLNQAQTYLDSINMLKEKYSDQIKIMSGFEIEYYPEFKEHYKWLRQNTDILILGQHYRFPLFHDYGNYNNDEDLKYYMQHITMAIDEKVVDIIAHPDYFMLGRSYWSEACTKAAHLICEKAKAADIPLEINLNGLRYGKKLLDGSYQYPYPYPLFWQIASQHGCKAILGYDAHNPATLSEDWRITKVMEILAGIDINIIDRL